MKKTSPKFSILIPTIGRHDLVRTAIESLSKQTCQDFEVIISDAHASEEVAKVVRDANDSRIRVIPPPDEGPFSTFDDAPRHARGEYMMWLDDDNCLLPFTLELFSDAIKRTGADIITGSHIYYYDKDHPKPNMRRSVGIVPFTGKEYSVDLKDTVRRLFSFSRAERKKEHPRFHSSTTIVSRRVTEKAYNRLGRVAFPDLVHVYSLQPILFSFAKTCHFIDRPVAVIGRLGVSMGQTWSTTARKRFEKRPPKPGLSPLSSYTKINGIFECYLRTHKELPEYFKDISIDTEQFAKIHLQELFVLDANMKTLLRDWREFFRFLETIKEPARTQLKRKAIRYAVLAPFVFLSRRFRIHHAKRIFVSMLTKKKERTKNRVQSWDREFQVPLPEGIEYETIVGVTAHTPRLILSITGRDITNKNAY